MSFDDRVKLEKQHKERMKQIELKNLREEYKEKEKESRFKKKRKLPSTSKLIVAYLFVVLNIVLAYSLIAMWHFGDLSFLGILITDIAAQIMVQFFYVFKARSENREGGLTYKLAVMEKEHEYEQEARVQKLENEIEDDGSVG